MSTFPSTSEWPRTSSNDFQRTCGIGWGHASSDSIRGSRQTVAQVVLREIDDPVKIKRWVEEFHDEFKCDEQPILDLAALGFELVLNTSPDMTVFELFSRVKPGAQAAYYDRTGKNPGMLPDASRESPVVFQLYGTLDNPRSMILSDSDRLDFIVKVARGDPALPVNLTSTLRDTDQSFLFLGFDLSEWHFRVLLHILSNNATRNYMSFASELESAPVDFDTQDFYRTSHKIHFFSGDLAGVLRPTAGEVRGRTTRRLRSGDRAARRSPRRLSCRRTHPSCSSATPARTPRRHARSPTVYARPGSARGWTRTTCAAGSTGTT